MTAKETSWFGSTPAGAPATTAYDSHSSIGTTWGAAPSAGWATTSFYTVGSFTHPLPPAAPVDKSPAVTTIPPPFKPWGSGWSFTTYSTEPVPVAPVASAWNTEPSAKVGVGSIVTPPPPRMDAVANSIWAPLPLHAAVAATKSGEGKKTSPLESMVDRKATDASQAALVFKEKVAHGSYGTVYRAVDPKTGREVAVKRPLVKSSFAGNFKELDIAQRMKGFPYLIELQDVYSKNDRFLGTEVMSARDSAIHDDDLYLGFEMAQGLDLEKLLEYNPTLSFGARKIFLVQILLAVEYMHKQGMIHRDIKSRNVMIVEVAEGRRIAKLGDFGFVKRPCDQEPESPNMGTPCYRPGEHARGFAYTEAGDIFGIGCVIYEMMVGSLLFLVKKDIDSLVLEVHADRTRGLAYKQAYGGINKPLFDSSPGPKWGDIEQIIDMCIRSDPLKRPTATELLDMPAFDAFRAHINDVRKAFPPKLPTFTKLMCYGSAITTFESPTTPVTPPAERAALRVKVLSRMPAFYEWLMTQPKCRHRIPFMAVDIWDRYTSWTFTNENYQPREQEALSILAVAAYISINYLINDSSTPFDVVLRLFDEKLVPQFTVALAAKVADHIIGTAARPGEICRPGPLEAASQSKKQLNAEDKKSLLKYVISNDLTGKTYQDVFAEWSAVKS